MALCDHLKSDKDNMSSVNNTVLITATVALTSDLPARALTPPAAPAAPDAASEELRGAASWSGEGSLTSSRTEDTQALGDT